MTSTLIEFIGASLDIRAVHVEPVGQRNHLLVVNDSIVFKFPRTGRGVEEIVKESALLQRLRRRLPLPIPDPVYENLKSVTVGTAFMGYARLTGRPLWRETLLGQSDNARTAIAKQLAHFLQTLHACVSAASG